LDLETKKRLDAPIKIVCELFYKDEKYINQFNIQLDDTDEFVDGVMERVVMSLRNKTKEIQGR
jgi:hypothetical protein